MSMTCLMVLLGVLGTCFLRKYVFDAYERVRCRNYYRVELAFSLPCQEKKGKSIFLCHVHGFFDLLIASVTYVESTPGNYYMHDVVSPKGAFWESSWQMMHGKTRYSPTRVSLAQDISGL